MSQWGTQSLKIKHNAEASHRLFLLHGNKCQQIHGHSLWIELEMWGPVDEEKGILDDLEFGLIKAAFRSFIDREFDHRCLLHHGDPWAVKDPMGKGKNCAQCLDPEVETCHEHSLPGLAVCAGDPSTENIARWIGNWAKDQFVDHRIGQIWQIRCTVDETRVNTATWEWSQI